MLVKTKGIVFRTIKYSETSIITDIFTKELGLRSYIVNGIRKAKPKFSQSLFQIMSQVDLIAYDHQHRNLNRIKEIRAEYYYSDIPFNIIKSSLGTFMIELCQKSIKEKEPNEAMYLFLADWFKFLDGSNHSLANLHLLFMVELSAMLGFQPMDNYNEENSAFFNLEEGYFIKSNMEGKYIMGEQESLTFNNLIHQNKESIHDFKLSRESRIMIIENLILFYKLHIENFQRLNSVDVLSEVLK